MTYKIKITERLSTTIQVKARSVTEALSKAERAYYNDKAIAGDLVGVEFVADLGANKTVKKELEQ